MYGRFKRRFFLLKGGKEADTVNLLFECIENCVFFSIVRRGIKRRD